jgi:YHS domain-containing protein
MLNQVAFQAGVGAGRLNESELLAAQGRTPHSDVSLTAATIPMGQTTAPARTAPHDPQAAAAAPQGPQLANPYAAQPAGPRYAPAGYTQPAANTTNAQAPNTAAFLQAAQARSQGATRPPQAAAPPAASQPAPAGRSIYDDPVEAAVPAPSHYAPQQQPVAPPRNNPLPGQAGSIYEPATQPRQPQQPVRQPNLPPQSSITHRPATQPPAHQPAPPVGQPTQRASAEFRSQQFVEVSKAPPRAIDGFCPVTILESTKWHKGDVRFGAVHGGRTYLFASAEAQKKFLADPQRYAPVLSGCDPVVFAETNQLVDGNHNIGLLIGGKTFFFTSEETLQRFKLSPQAYADRAYQAMNAGQLRTR